MRSALFTGTLVHRRYGPRPHRFSYRLAYPHLFLDEVDEVFDAHPLWSHGGRNAVSLRRDDHLPDTPGDLAGAVRHHLDRAGRPSGGAISQLALVRTWGWLFDPIALWFHHGPTGAVDGAVVEVTNTPWKQRTVYVLGGPGDHVVDKAMHVSPFMPMDQRYHLTYSEPGTRFRLRIASVEGDRTVHEAVLSLAATPLDRAAMGRYLWRHPGLTMRVSAGIHAQAIRLAAKGVPFHRNPGRDNPPDRHRDRQEARQ